MVVRGSFQLLRVFVPSDLYLMFRISSVLFIISMNCISALCFSSFFSRIAFATDWRSTYTKFRCTCMSKFQYIGLHVHGLTSPRNPCLHSIETKWQFNQKCPTKVASERYHQDFYIAITMRYAMCRFPLEVLVI